LQKLIRKELWGGKILENSKKNRKTFLPAMKKSKLNRNMVLEGIYEKKLMAQLHTGLRGLKIGNNM